MILLAPPNMMVKNISYKFKKYPDDGLTVIFTILVGLPLLIHI